MNDEKTVRLDRMRYAKNSFSSGFALLAMLFDVFFFISLYESDVGNYYYNILIGASILYNLIFMLAAFLSSEGVKNYKIGYSWLMILLGAGQIARIFIYPAQAHAAVATVREQSAAVMSDGQFYRLTAYLLLSAACLFIGAIAGVSRSRALSAHLASPERRSA